MKITDPFRKQAASHRGDDPEAKRAGHSVPAVLELFSGHIGQLQKRADFLVGRAGLQLYLGHGGYGSQSLATESHGGEGKKVVGLVYLGSSMALKRQTGIGLRHAFAVVDHLNQCPPRVEQDDFDLRGSGIDRVFHQFLDYGRRTLYDLARSYLIGHRVGKKTYYIAHNLTSLSSRNRQRPPILPKQPPLPCLRLREKRLPSL